MDKRSCNDWEDWEIWRLLCHDHLLKESCLVGEASEIIFHALWTSYRSENQVRIIEGVFENICPWTGTTLIEATSFMRTARWLYTNIFSSPIQTLTELPYWRDILSRWYSTSFPISLSSTSIIIKPFLTLSCLTVYMILLLQTFVELIKRSIYIINITACGQTVLV